MNTPLRHLMVLAAASLAISAIVLSERAWGAEAPVRVSDLDHLGLELTDANIVPSDSGYLLTGRLTNALSKYTLRNVEVRIAAQDCSKTGGFVACVDVADQEVTIRAAVAPKASSAVKVPVHFNETPIKIDGWLEWTVWIVKAERQ